MHRRLAAPQVVEAAAGAPYLSGASIPVNMTGPEARRRGAAALAWTLLRAGAAYDKDMGLEAEDRE